MGRLEGRVHSPVLTCGSASPHCLLAMDVCFLPGVSCCLRASCLLQSPTDCSSHPQTHIPCMSSPRLCLCAAALVRHQKPSRGSLFFPTTGNGMRRHPAPLQALALLLRRQGAPQSHSRISCAPAVRVPAETEVETREVTAQGLRSLPAGEGQNRCWFSGKTSSLPIPLELFLHMESPSSRLPALSAASWCLCAPAARLHFLWKKQ